MCVCVCCPQSEKEETNYLARSRPIRPSFIKKATRSSLSLSLSLSFSLSYGTVRFWEKLGPAGSSLQIAAVCHGADPTWRLTPAKISDLNRTGSEKSEQELGGFLFKLFFNPWILVVTREISFGRLHKNRRATDFKMRSIDENHDRFNIFNDAI